MIGHNTCPMSFLLIREHLQSSLYLCFAGVTNLAGTRSITMFLNSDAGLRRPINCWLLCPFHPAKHMPNLTNIFWHEYGHPALHVAAHFLQFWDRSFPQGHYFLMSDFPLNNRKAATDHELRLPTADGRRGHCLKPLRCWFEGTTVLAESGLSWLTILSTWMTLEPRTHFLRPVLVRNGVSP